MKESVKWIIGGIALAVLITGAYLLYDKLSSDIGGGGLVVDMTDTEQTTEENTDISSDPQADTETDAPAPSTDGETTAAISEEETTAPTEEPTNPAPDFTVVNRDGNEVKLSDMRGKPVVLNFWATWCGYCKLEMPDFNEMYEKYGEDVHFMMVNMTDASETVQKATAYVDGEGYSFPIYFDTKSLAAYAYSVSSLPVSYFIDANGNLVAHALGAIDAATVEQGIGMILK